MERTIYNVPGDDRDPHAAEVILLYLARWICMNGDAANDPEIPEEGGVRRVEVTAYRLSYRMDVYALDRWSTRCTIGTYRRKWRQLKSSPANALDEMGVYVAPVEESMHNNDESTTWELNVDLDRFREAVTTADLFTRFNWL